MAFWLSPEVSTLDPIISPRALDLTSSNDQRYMRGMITSLRSKYMTSGYHHGGLITSVAKHSRQSHLIALLCIISLVFKINKTCKH